MASILRGIMSGIGFIGAGAILKNDDYVRGTASAASIWVTGALGATMKHVCHELMLEDGCVSRYFLNPEIALHIAGLPDPGEEAKAYMDAAEKPF